MTSQFEGVAGDPGTGYTTTLEGPSSLFKHTTLYGIRFAAFLPALLHTTKWSLEVAERLEGRPSPT